jgi:hypothetical protein
MGMKKYFLKKLRAKNMTIKELNPENSNLAKFSMVFCPKLSKERFILPNSTYLESA